MYEGQTKQCPKVQVQANKQRMMYNILHRKLIFEQREPYYKQEMNSGLG